MPKYKISWKVLKNLAQEFSNGDLWLTLSFLWHGKNCFCSFIWEEFMGFVNKYTEIGEHKNTFLALEAEIIL